MDEALVSKAVAALQKYHRTAQKKAKPRLIEDDPLISMVIALKKIPDRTIRPLRVSLPHSLHPVGETELCLITKGDKKETKELLEAKEIEGISKIIPITKLKTNYKSFEAKRQLSSCYDLFLADRRLYQMLPRLLGKKFFEKKKFPIPVDLRKKDLVYEIQKARDSTYLHIGLGSCCNIPIGRVAFTPDQLISNTLSAIKGVSSHLPGGIRNIQSVHLKTPDSIALPVYNSLPPPPGLLPATSAEGQAAKRIKLDPEANNKDDLESVSAKESNDSNQKKTVKFADLPLERCLEYDTDGSSEAASKKMDRLKEKRKAKVSKLSVKKVRGSTVQSSKHEKALRHKTRI